MRHSIETTDEELLPSVNRRSRVTPILVVCVANLAGAVGVIHNSEPEETNCATGDSSSSLNARATYDTHTGDMLDLDLEVPEMHREKYVSFIPNALDDPLVQLTTRTGDVTRVVAGVSQPMQGTLCFQASAPKAGSTTAVLIVIPKKR